ncbi:MAG TPA: type II toxin-antitoxin system VapC family toxin [Terracidiphilus sp.]|nr:type II toxin-antitoxin system VapC family toxin [Terracidiphilus sp.]
MRIAVDTNVLLRDALQDDPRQSAIAAKTLRKAELVVVPASALCEFVWVMRRLYQRSSAEIARSIRLLMSGDNVEMDRPAIEAGLEVLEKGGDFADGVIAYQGHWLGADEFVSFDKQAVALLKAQGRRVRLLL